MSGLATGTLINNSASVAAIGAMVSEIGLEGGLMTVFVIVLLTLALSDVTFNTATVVIAIPVETSIMQGIEEGSPSLRICGYCGRESVFYTADFHSCNACRLWFAANKVYAKGGT